MRLLILSTFSLIVSGCSLLQEKQDGAPAPPAQLVFFSPMDSVWRAAQLALKYPIRVNNMDSGTIETEWILASDGFRPPLSEGLYQKGVRYKISLIFLKGSVDGKPSVKVTVVKRVERVKDFFSEPESSLSDGLEEKIILYRIGRELRIEEGIKKSVKKENSKQ